MKDILGYTQLVLAMYDLDIEVEWVEKGDGDAYAATRHWPEPDKSWRCKIELYPLIRNASDIHEVVLHEAAHVVHFDRLEQKIRDYASGMFGPQYPWYALVGASKAVMKGDDSAHGKNWKRIAKELGIDSPKSYVWSK